MRGTTEEEDGFTSFSDVLMLSDDVLNSGDVGEDGSGFTGNETSQVLSFGGGNQNDAELLFSQPSFSPASPLSSRTNAFAVDDKSCICNKKKTSSGDEHDRVCDPKPGKRCKRDQTKSSVGNVKVKKEKVGERITALQQLVSPYGKDDKDTGGVNPTMKVKELRSNGLCLVPLAWTVHVANTNGADLWSSAILSPVTPTVNQ
ncbi:unnamed protein product [Arabidopsis arenosa]|uniref:Uncharacterized protein n=1 Tax=Arabidopsis arenosa TaxID=38785 RepID=A0A8S1ZQL3_ARAAE|nr:unnamed protein product [Arabidopsis arenosa]